MLSKLIASCFRCDKQKDSIMLITPLIYKTTSKEEFKRMYLRIGERDKTNLAIKKKKEIRSKREFKYLDVKREDYGGKIRMI